MPLFETQLALEYFQARSLKDRTHATLAGIVQHVCQTSALTPESTQAVLEEAQAMAQQRGLLREDTP